MSISTDMLSIEQAKKMSASSGFAKSQDYEKVIEQLELYECWTPWFEAVKTHIKLVPDSSLADYIRMIRVNLTYFDNIEAGAAHCKELLNARSMSYAEFRRLVLDQLIESEDYRTEAVLLSGVWEMFTQREDQISAVERLCFIYEKKAHNEFSLHQFYEKLRQMHPENAKALRYFRNLFSQSQEWPAVIEVLNKLLSSAKHKQETFRYAQELAAVYLYQLGDCKEAIRYIEEYCSGSTLDTSTIHYEAYYRMGNLDGCLRVLRSALLAVEDQATRAIIHYRIASIYEQLNQFQLAHENFQKALELNDDFFEAIEGLVSSSLRLKNWSIAKDWLNVLAGRTRAPNLVSQIKAGIQRLEEGLAHAKP